MDYVLSDEEGGIVPKVLRDGLVFKDEDGQVIFNQYSFCELVKHLLVELVGISYEEASQIVERSPLAAPVDNAMDVAIVPFPVSWTVKMKKKQKETQDILSYHSQAAGCSDKARAKASGGRQPIEECGRTGL